VLDRATDWFKGTSLAGNHGNSREINDGFLELFNYLPLNFMGFLWDSMGC
jgi:hypothetical protein